MDILEQAAEETELCIRQIEQVGSDCAKITVGTGPVFFVRWAYLKVLTPDEICEGALLSAEKSEDLIQAGLAFAAEKKADDYLARAEQSRFGLTQKLAKKGHSRESIDAALDYLDGRGFLSDSRFAESWLRTHAISKSQGRSRLLKELLSRGISRSIANEALDVFFEEHDEEDLCRKACAKALRSGKKDEKLLKYLIDAGFPYKMAQMVMKEED